MQHLVEFLGRLHPLVVHLPIGILVLAICLHFLSRWPRYAALRAVLPVLWFAGALTAVLACGAGFLLVAGGDYAAGAVDTHRLAGLGLTALAILLLVARNRAWPARLQTAAVSALALLLVVTGHFGGNLTHGEDYLSQPLYAMMGQKPAKIARPPVTDINQALVYRDLVEPVLEQKCWQCHSAEKQKGKLRLDTKEFLLQGGKHGEVLAAGSSAKSELYKRLILPEDHDDRMPPKGKPQLTVEEIALIRWWIDQGQGDFSRKVAQVPADDKIKTLLAGMASGPGDDNARQAGTQQPSEIPTAKVAPADPGVLRKLEGLGAAITPLTADRVFLAVNLGTAPSFTDEQVNLLLQLRNQILWLDLSETAITDRALPAIGKLKHLTRLKLDNTRITDAGLPAITGLQKLRALNLYGTQVSDQGLKTLQQCKSLQVVYLWRTQVTAPGVAALQTALGDQAEVNFGSMAEANDTITDTL
ncbi:MAG: c-type cytochrome domain-containing protein [Adhaeribacter sp.]